MQVLVAAGGSSWRHNGKSPAKSASQNLAAVDRQYQQLFLQEPIDG
jgi:hypothetical protein